MSISIMGSIGSYTKTLRLQTQWNLKQQSGDYSSHKKSLSEWLESAQKTLNQTPERDEETHKKLSDIMQKIYAGQKLTNQEKRYLQAKDPQAYEKLRSAEQEQKAFEQKLRQCRTKEEVQRLKMTRLASSMATVKATINNPRIPLNKKLEICMQEKIRCDRLEKSTQNFVKSGEYNRLPTEAEQAKAQKEEREKQEASRKPQSGQSEQTAQTGPEVSTETEQTPVQPEAKNEQAAQDSAKEKTAASAQTLTKPAVKVRASASGPARSRTTGYISPELRKVRRARRQAASAAYRATANPAAGAATPSVNINA